MIKSPSELGVLDKFLRDYQMPNRLAFEVEMQRCVLRYHDPLTGDAEADVRETIVQMCEQDLNSVARQYRSSMDNYFALILYTAQLHLYVLALLKQKQRPGHNIIPLHSVQTNRYQQLGMRAAYTLIDTFCEIGNASDNCLIDACRALPKQFFIGLLLATFFLLRYYVLSPMCEDDQRTSSRNKVLKVHAKLKDFSSHQFTEPGRAAAVIEVLCRHGAIEGLDTGEDIDDRGVASISWSALVAAANLRGKRSLRTVWLENINPSSPGLHSDWQHSTSHGHDREHTSSLESFDFDYPLPDNIWEQSFLQMLDLSAYETTGP